MVRRWASSLTLGGVLGYLVALPILFVVWSSFKPSGLVLDEGFTLDHYGDLFSDPTTGRVFLNTVQFAAGATAISLVLGIVLVWLVERTDAPLRRLMRVLILLPMATPPVLLAIGWVTALDPSIGIVNLALMNLFDWDEAPIPIFSMGGMIAVESMTLVPTVFLILSPAFRNMDPNLEDAAFASGANLWTTARKIMLPILSPAILSAAIFVFILSFVIFDIPGIIGVPAGEPVFSTRIVQYAVDSPTGLPEYGRVSALAVLAMIALFAFAFVYNRMTRRSERFITVTGKGFRAKSFRLGKWRGVVAGGIVMYFLVAIVVPLSMLLWLSLMPYRTGVSIEAASMMTFDNYLRLPANARLIGGAGNTVVIALVAGTAVTLLSVIISWVIIRQKAPGRKMIDLLAFAPLGLSGVMMGTALIFVYLSFDALPVYGSIWIIAIAYVTAYLSFGSRLTNSVMMQISAELEDAASASGANRLQVFRRVTIPLMRPALIGLWVWVVAHSMRELSTALMLQGQSNQVFSTVLWEYWVGGQPTTAAAAGIVMVVVLAALVSIWQFVGNRSQISSKGM